MLSVCINYEKLQVKEQANSNETVRIKELFSGNKTVAFLSFTLLKQIHLKTLGRNQATSIKSYQHRQLRNNLPTCSSTLKVATQSGSQIEK
jgi:hypothetical protein